MPIHYGNVRGNLYSARQQQAEGGRKEFESKLTKRCCGCGKVLPLDAFGFDLIGEYGRFRYCRKCNKAGMKVKLEGRDHE